MWESAILLQATVKLLFSLMKFWGFHSFVCFIAKKMKSEGCKGWEMMCVIYSTCVTFGSVIKFLFWQTCLSVLQYFEIGLLFKRFLFWVQQFLHWKILDNHWPQEKNLQTKDLNISQSNLCKQVKKWTPQSYFFTTLCVLFHYLKIPLGGAHAQEELKPS